jgi:AcrR family transcriptional regulator
MPVATAPAPTRARLVATARRLLDAEGLEGVGLREIARRGGLSHGAPLRHFPSLPALLAAVAADGFRELVQAIDAAVAGAGPAADARARLAAAGRSYVRFALANPGVFALMFRPERLDPTDAALAAAGAASYGQLRALCAAAQRDGLHADVPLDHLAAVTWSTVHGLATLRLHGALGGALGSGDADAAVEAIHDTIDAMLLGVPPRRRRAARRTR